MVTVSAATALIVVMTSASSVVVMMVAALVMMVATAAATVVAATATTARQVLDHHLDLLVGGIPVLEYLTLEIQVAACQRMVGIDGNTVDIYLEHTGHETLIITVHQGNDGTWVDILMVEMSVDGEHLTIHLVNTLRVVVAKSLSLVDDKVELASLLQGDDLLLKSFERYAKAADKLVRTLYVGLFL